MNWNAEQFLPNCLKSIYSQNYKNFEVILVDNASTDNSVAIVKKRFPTVRIIQNSKNLGYAKGNNIGMREATGNYILLLNTDTIVSEGAIGRMVKAFEIDKDLGIVGCRLVLPNGKLDHQGAAFFNPYNHLLEILRIKKEQIVKRDGLLYVDWVKGAALMAKKDVLKKIGLLDPEYFTYFEDMDLCKRAKDAGYRVGCVVDDEIQHIMMGSSKPKKESTIIFRRNRMLYWLKNSKIYQFPIIIPWDAGKVIKNIVLFLISNESLYLWEIEGMVKAYIYLLYRVFS